jgi:hypothetical protein
MPHRQIRKARIAKCNKHRTKQSHPVSLRHYCRFSAAVAVAAAATPTP